jgi:hypothetical protein
MVMRADLPALPLTTVRLGVEPRQASVRLSAPDGTEVYSGESGRVHALPNDMWGPSKEAAFRVEIWAPGYHPKEETFDLTRHQPHLLEFVLNEIVTKLSIRSEPEGATVSDAFLGKLGVTPLYDEVSLADLQRARARRGVAPDNAARLVLTFSKGGFRSRAQQVDIDFEKSENSVSVELDPIESGAQGGA